MNISGLLDEEPPSSTPVLPSPIPSMTPSSELAVRVMENTKNFGDGLVSTGFEIPGKEHAISSGFLGNAGLSQQFPAKLLERTIPAIVPYLPLVPRGRPRIRTQILAANTREHLDQAREDFVEVGREFGICQELLLIFKDTNPEEAPGTHRLI